MQKYGSKEISKSNGSKQEEEEYFPYLNMKKLKSRRWVFFGFDAILISTFFRK